MSSVHTPETHCPVAPEMNMAIVDVLAVRQDSDAIRIVAPNLEVMPNPRGEYAYYRLAVKALATSRHKGIPAEEQKTAAQIVTTIEKHHPDWVTSSDDEHLVLSTN